MSEALKTIAACEWIILGFITLHGLRRWNRKLDFLYAELKKEMEVSDGQET